MNAITPITEILSDGMLSARAASAESAGPHSSRKVPVFRGRDRVGTVDTRATSEGLVDTLSELVTSLSAIPEDGIVRLWGEVDSVHDVLALRTRAAARPLVRAIIDELWIACE